MSTNLPGVFAAGDIAVYTGKVPLIAIGFGEAALAVNNAAPLVEPRAGCVPGPLERGVELSPGFPRDAFAGRPRRQRGVRRDVQRAGTSPAPPARVSRSSRAWTPGSIPLSIVGMEVGDVKILRNAGARVTDDVLRTLVLATHLLGVNRVLVMPHTELQDGVRHRGRDPRGARERPPGSTPGAWTSLSCRTRSRRSGTTWSGSAPSPTSPTTWWSEGRSTTW